MLRRLTLLAFCTAILASAQMRLTIEQLKEFVRSSVVLHHDDRKVAEYLKKVKLANQLDAATVEDLQGVEGVGESRARGVREAISRLADASIIDRYP